MNSSKKKLFPILFVFVTFIGIYYLFSNRMANLEEYNQKISLAREAAENNILVDARKYYDEALAIHVSPELYEEVANMYLDKEMYQDAERWYERTMLPAYPKEPCTYLVGIKAAIGKNHMADAFDIYDTYQKRKLSDERVEAEIKSIWYAYDRGSRYDQVGPFSNLSGYAAVCTDGLWGYQTASDSLEIGQEYQAAGICGEVAPVIDQSGNAFFIDQEGNVKIPAELFEKEDPEFGKIKEFRGYESGLILASNGETWNFYNAETHKKAFGGFSDAKVVVNGVGAAADEMGMWALINEEGSPTTDFKYQEVLSDRKGYICKDGAVIVNETGKYYLVDSSGNKISSQAYTDARAFYDYSSLAAVKKGTEWLFIDEAGQEYNLGKFDEADSFSNGLAAVSIDGKWGYIDRNGDFALPCQFAGAEPVSPFGVCFVKETEDSYTFLSFYKDNH